tara:strand:- start:21189 stop:21956 length:768 start_codon:yes stop_codon:yes gene_type:complete
MQSLIEKIKEKPSLKNIQDSFLKKHIQNYIKIYSPDLTKKSQKTKLIKEVRRKANIAFGMFQTKEGKKLPELLKKLKQNPNSLEIHNEILKTNKSTKERLQNYPLIYKKIIKNEKSILDLGCGLNPISYPYLNKKVEYHAYDLYTQPIKEYFKIKNIKGTAKDIDLTNFHKFPKTDICFLFKFLDSIDIKNHKPSEELIKSISSKKVVISFPLKTLKNKTMTTQERPWLKLMCKRLNYKLTSFKTDNEIFYLLIK